MEVTSGLVLRVVTWRDGNRSQVTGSSDVNGR